MSANPTLRKVQDLLTKTEKHLHNMFIAGTVFGALCCFARADYNLPMFAFLYVMFDQDDNDKIKLMFLMALSFLGDLLWLFYWVPFWYSSEMAKWNQGLHSFVILCAVGNLVLKLIIIGTLATVNQADLKNSLGRFRNMGQAQAK